MGYASAEDTNQKVDISKHLSLPFLALMMLTTSFIWAGAVFFYDFPQLFEEILLTQFKTDTFGVGLLYSMASVPLLILIPCFSSLVSSLGLNVSAVVFNTCVFTGVLLCFLGARYQNFNLMIAGRFIFGVGFDCSYVIQASCTEKWFSGRFLTNAFGINRIVCYTLSSLGAYYAPNLFLEHRTLEAPLFFYGVVTAFCWFMSFLFYILDMRNEHLLGLDSSEEQKKERFTIADFPKISLQAWLLLVLFSVLSNCFYQFTNFGTDCLIIRFGFKYVEAKNTMAILPIVNMLSTPVFSSTISVVGKKGLFLCLSALVIIANFTFMTILGENDKRAAIGAAGVGVFFSMLVSSFWSSFTLSLPKQAVSVLFALCIAGQNLMLAILPPLFSHLNKDRTPEAYQNCLYLLILIGVICFVIAVIVTIKDFRENKIIHLPENSEKVKKFREQLNAEFSLAKKKEAENSDYKSLKGTVDTSSEGRTKNQETRVSTGSEDALN